MKISVRLNFVCVLVLFHNDGNQLQCFPFSLFIIFSSFCFVLFLPLSSTTAGNRPLQLATLIMLRSNTKTSPNLLLGSSYGKGPGAKGERERQGRGVGGGGYLRFMMTFHSRFYLVTY